MSPKYIYRKVFILLLSCVQFNLAFAEVKQITEDEPVVRISFGEKVDAGMLNCANYKDVKWQITTSKGEIFKLNGDSLFAWSFDLPGGYQLAVLTDDHTHSANHSHSGHVCGAYVGPKSWRIEVSPLRLHFLCEQMTFSTPLRGETELSGIKMLIPVEVHLHAGAEVDADIFPKQISSYGIRSSIAGKLTLVSDDASGNKILSYKLSGQGTSGTYIGFDLTDHNGRVTACGLNTPL